MQISNGECMCLDGFYFDYKIGLCQCNRGAYLSAPNTCTPCPWGCLECTATDGCLFCDALNNFQLSAVGPPGQCECVKGYIEVDPANALSLLSLTVADSICAHCGDLIPNCLACSDLTTCVSCGSYFSARDGVCRDICGDGYAIEDECDDGNIIDGDGCSSSCRKEIISMSE